MSGGVFSPQALEFIASRSRELLHKPFERESLRKFVERLCGAARPERAQLTLYQCAKR